MTTQYANASYQEIIDLHTESDRVSVVGIHTPNSDTPYHMLKGFWDQFRKFKYNGCSISLVPAAQLPIDPLQVSYDASEPTIDPRDMLNPILFHGCHGNDMGAILNQLYQEPVSGANQVIDTQISDSTEHNLFTTSTDPNLTGIGELFESLYYRALTDKTWLKAHPQRGFRKSGLHPMVYSLASTVQFAGSITDTNLTSRYTVHDDDTGEPTSQRGALMGDASGSFAIAGAPGRVGFARSGNINLWESPYSKGLDGFLTPRLQRLGWMDTRNVLTAQATLNQAIGDLTPENMNDALATLYKRSNSWTTPALTPKIFMGMIMLPPAYKTEQHFRLVLNHSFSFAKFRGASMQYDDLGSIKKAYGYFDYSGEEESKHIDPPEPELKEVVDDGTDDKQ